MREFIKLWLKFSVWMCTWTLLAVGLGLFYAVQRVGSRYHCI